MTKQRLDRIGGAGCLLIGVGCVWLAFRDWDNGQSMWKVWVGMCVILMLNGVAMIRHAGRAGAAGGGSRLVAPGGVVPGSTRS